RSIVGDAPTADTLEAASRRLAVQAAERMGRITNMSLQFVEQSLPALTRTPEGNKILLEAMERTSRREIEIAEIAEEFARKGELRPEGERSYYQTVRDLEERDPVISAELRQRIVEGAARAPSSWADALPAASEAPQVSTQAEVDDLPPGAEFLWTMPDGTTQRMVKE
ncbi:MAG: hypothetical protein ACRCU1_18355, partial [Alsobacter sp.]